jgi:hypothetical protein
VARDTSTGSTCRRFGRVGVPSISTTPEKRLSLRVPKASAMEPATICSFF